jgi:nitrite reductase (NADH) small subunit
VSWTRITVPENIPLREGRAVQLPGQEIAVFNLGDRFLAVDNRCPHKGGPLADGIVSGSAVICPLHSWRLCLETGDVQRPAGQPCGVETYRTRVENGLLWIDLDARKEAAA